MALILLTIAAFCLLLGLIGYLLKDFTRFLYKITIGVFKPSNKDIFYTGEVLLTLFSCLFISAVALVFMKSATALIAWVFSDDLISFFTVLRSVYTTTNEMRSPFQHIVPGLLISPIIHFCTVFLIFRGVRVFFSWVNGRYNNCYEESDSVFFGFISVMGLVLLDILLFAQNIIPINAIAHFTFLALSKIAYVFYYLTLSHINMLRNDDYRNALPEYVKMSSIEKKISLSPWRFIIFSYFIGVLLLLPFHFGIQFLHSNWQVLTFLIIICGIAFFLLQYTLSKGWNFLGTVLLNSSFNIDGISDNLYSFPPKIKKLFLFLFLLAMAGFAIIHWDLFLMVLLIALLPIIITAIGLIVVYFVGTLLPNIRFFLKKGTLHIFSWKTISRYFATVSVAISKAILPCSFLIFTIFMLLSVFPKPFKYNNPDIKKSLVDKDNDILYIDRSKDGSYCIPLQHSEIPSFLLSSIINQEDRSFNLQNDWKLNTSNWHGISPAFLLRNRGGSNINMQLIKNLSFNGVFPQDLSRKIAELLASYQLSISQNKQDIMSWYVNSVSFHGGKGFVGLEAASLYTFGRPINQLNTLEQLYLVSTLPRGKTFASRSDIIKYAEVQNYSEEIKQSLVDRATIWYNDGLIQKRELNLLKRDSLHFANRNYQSDISTSSRLFLERELKPYSDGKYVSSITKKNQQKLQTAYIEYEKNRYFPPILQKNDYTLYAAAQVIDYRSGEILAHFCNHTEDLTSFGNGFPMSSTIKPFVLLQMLEEGISTISLYDGKLLGKKTPLNAGRPYTNKYAGVQTILSQSLNAPMVNISEICNPLLLFQKVEGKFETMGITAQKELCYDTYNYPMGSRLITLREIAQAYQCLLNDGIYKELTAISSVFNIETNKVETLPSKLDQQIYQLQNTDIIKEALSHTLIEGTAMSLLKMLPDGQQFYIKTGTSNDGANHGYCALADNNILIVSWLSYGKIENGTLRLNGTPPIPYNSGGKSAGVFAAMIYNKFYND